METPNTNLTCVRCNIPQPEKNFNWRNKALKKRSCWCKTCSTKSQRATYQKYRNANIEKTKTGKAARKQIAREYVMDYLSEHPCVDCGEDDPIVLHFDHLKDKERGISQMVCTGGYSLETVKAEIMKCEVRCANCHMRKTAKQFNWPTLKWSS